MRNIVTLVLTALCVAGTVVVVAVRPPTPIWLAIVAVQFVLVLVLGWRAAVSRRALRKMRGGAA